jgi:hypothetical protein
MKKLLLVVIIILIILSSCTKDIEDFEYYSNDSLLKVIRWNISGSDKILHYEFREGPGISRLTTCWVYTNMQAGTKMENAKMGEIEQGDGFLSFKINGTKYIYRYE